MTDFNLIQRFQKDCVVWSERRERLLALRIYYDSSWVNGCNLLAMREIREVA